YGNYVFQPFIDKDTFEKYVTSSKDGEFIMSSWHFESIKNKLALADMMVGQYKGRTTQKWVLSSKLEPKDIVKIKGGKVAAATSDEYSRSVLKKMLGEKGDLIDSTTILIVPKDMDALMSVIFGLADFALTTENSLDTLGTINKNQYDMFNKIVKSKDILLPIVAVRSDNPESVKKLLKITGEMGNNPEGKKVLKLINIDAWKWLKGD
ncbi:MAG: hypothetical protein HQK89_18105, partial [Nitrospirae bacterium]|nr:hypothetical protein [Nitrospirota bacterium]